MQVTGGKGTQKGNECTACWSGCGALLNLPRRLLVRMAIGTTTIVASTSCIVHSRMMVFSLGTGDIPMVMVIMKVLQ